MDHFPIFLSTKTARIIVAGGGDAAMAKLRILMKSSAKITVFAADPAPEIEQWHHAGRLTLVTRAMDYGDALCAKLFYAASEDDAEDARTAHLAMTCGALVNIVDNLEDSQFITPAIVDRDPVTIAIGTEGAAPVLARAIKADLEERLPQNLGTLARVGKTFRKASYALPFGHQRRDFWRAFYFDAGPKAVAEGEDQVLPALNALLDAHLTKPARAGHVAFVGGGPGDPELLTLKARRALDEADVVIYDRLITPEILDLARREAVMIDVGKEGFGPSTSQDHINALLVEHAKTGASASAAVAAIGQSMTKRGRNASVRFLTGHDTRGFADHDWRTLAREGEVAAIYMGKKSARFIQGRLLMHGADRHTPVTLIENASRPEQRVIETTLAALPAALDAAQLSGPALTFLGLAPRAALAAVPALPLEEFANA